MSKGTTSSFDYTQTSGLAEIRLRLEFLANRLSERLAAEPAPRLLEVGIGTGDCTMMLASMFSDVSSIDLDPIVCKRTTERLENAGRSGLKVICAPVEAHAFDGRFDAVILQNILEHIEDPVAMLRRLREILTPEGRLYINVPLAHSLHRLMGVELGMIPAVDALSESDIEYGHYRVYSPDRMRDHIQRAGLRRVFEMPYYLKPLSTEMLRALSDEQHRALFSLGRKFPDFASYYYTEAGLL